MGLSGISESLIYDYNVLHKLYLLAAVAPVGTCIKCRLISPDTNDDFHVFL